jgi:hypothetical protein
MQLISFSFRDGPRPLSKILLHLLLLLVWPFVLVQVIKAKLELETSLNFPEKYIINALFNSEAHVYYTWELPVGIKTPPIYISQPPNNFLQIIWPALKS